VVIGNSMEVKMSEGFAYNLLSAKELQRWIGEKRPFFLIDTLPNDHFRTIHLPGAGNACVYEVTFLDQVKAITADINSVIVLYGSGTSTLDAVKGAEKLHRDGFLQLHVLEGGLAAWRSAGFTVIGDGIDRADDPQTILRLDDQSYLVDPDLSTIVWSGRNPSTTHFGNIRLTSGELRVDHTRITGSLDIDMHSITNINLAGDVLQPVLIAHLHSDDFFDVDLFPVARYSIRNGRPVPEPYTSSPNYELEGILELKGVKAGHDCMATVAKTTDNGISLEAHFDLDRTRWGILYGSSRYFEHLGMHLVFDPISIQIRIIAHARQ